MDLTQFSYWYLIIITLLIGLGFAYAKRRRMQAKVMEANNDATYHNRYILQEIKSTLGDYENYLDLIDTQMPQGLPDIQKEKQEIKAKINYLGNLHLVLASHDITKTITDDHWAHYITLAKGLASRAIDKGQMKEAIKYIPLNGKPAGTQSIIPLPNEIR
jgi:hypothetical protein